MSKRKKKKNKKIILLAVLGIIILTTVGAVSGYVWNIQKENSVWDKVIYPGVTVAGVNLKGKSKEEAINLLKEEFGQEVLKKKINVSAGEKVYTIDYKKLNAKYDIENVVDEAFNYGKDLEMFDKHKLIKSSSSKPYELEFSYDDKYIGEIVNTIEKEINKEPVNASIEMVSRGKFNVTPDVKGYKLEKDKLHSEIIGKINGELEGDVDINAPITELTAAVTGKLLSTIDEKIASFGTSYTTSSYERSNNIALATRSINGRLLLPGDTFSFNETVGERTKARGYKEAGVIINNQIESGLGGGICQVSSTLYNAMLKTEIKSTERRHHSLRSTYVGLGMDATVDWGNIDYKFKNTLDYPVYIEGYVQNKNVYFNVYSNSSLTKRTYSLVNDVYQTIPSTTKTIEDPTLPEGTTEIEKKASDGYRVRVIRRTHENGKTIKSEVLYTDYYRPVNGVVRKGTKKVVQPPKTEGTPKTTTGQENPNTTTGNQENTETQGQSNTATEQQPQQ
jgi:vancomycin resistance protein YoaR